MIWLRIPNFRKIIPSDGTSTHAPLFSHRREIAKAGRAGQPADVNSVCGAIVVSRSLLAEPPRPGYLVALALLNSSQPLSASASPLRHPIYQSYLHRMLRNVLICMSFADALIQTCYSVRRPPPCITYLLV